MEYRFHPRERRVCSAAEKALQLGIRAQQLERNAPAFVPLPVARDPMSIAVAEVRAGVCPVVIVRRTLAGELAVPPLTNPEFGNGGFLFS